MDISHWKEIYDSSSALALSSPLTTIYFSERIALFSSFLFYLFHLFVAWFYETSIFHILFFFCCCSLFSLLMIFVDFLHGGFLLSTFFSPSSLISTFILLYDWELSIVALMSLLFSFISNHIISSCHNITISRLQKTNKNSRKKL